MLNTFFISAMTLAAHRSADRDPPRVPHVDVLADRQIERVARDEQRPIAVDAVAVQVDVRQMFTGRPLLSCSRTPIWLPSSSARTTAFDALLCDV